MHVLTKIFIVLVSLLAVLLVPLVVVYAQNEETYKSKYDQAMAQAAAAKAAKAQADASHAVIVDRLRADIDAATAAQTSLTKSDNEKLIQIRKLEGELITAKAMQAEIRSELGVLAQTADANQKLTDSLVGELRSLRETALQAERQLVELDEANRELNGQLAVAVAARRALEEELQQLREENAVAIDTVGQYMTVYGPLSTDRFVASAEGVTPTRNLDATIINVTREYDGQVLAEIDAGARDGVQEGWKMTIAQGGNFIGNLRIISVDINRSTGVVSHEDPIARGSVQVGHRVTARKGMD